MSKLDKLKMLLPMEELEISAQQQIYTALELPFLEKLAIMPDCHTGYSLPIGGVALLNNVISPPYVGYDIGCGMVCLNTGDYYKRFFDDRQDIYGRIKTYIPHGFDHQKHAKPYPEFKSASGDRELDKTINELIGTSLHTLGGGKVIASRPQLN
jgi:tRNA-splicing ligase RtcB (3'-phosphate/5'-hydroxy nucleic acid ligase)